MKIEVPETREKWNAAGRDYLPGHLGMRFLKIEEDEACVDRENRAAAARAVR